MTDYSHHVIVSIELRNSSFGAHSTRLPPANSNDLTGPLDASNSIWYTLRLNRMRKYILRRGTDEFFWCHEQEIELRTHSFKNGVQCSPCRGVTDGFR